MIIFIFFKTILKYFLHLQLKNTINLNVLVNTLCLSKMINVMMFSKIKKFYTHHRN